MRFCCYILGFILFCCGCEQDTRFTELDVRRPFGFEVGGSADEAIKRGGWDLRTTLRGGEPASVLMGVGGEFTKVTGLRFRCVGLDWKSRLFTRIEACAAEDATEEIARSAYKRLCKVVKQKFGCAPCECNKNQPLYCGVVLEEQVWREARRGHTFVYKVQLVVGRQYWSVCYTVEDVELVREVFQRETQRSDPSTAPMNVRPLIPIQKQTRSSTNDVQEIEVDI